MSVETGSAVATFADSDDELAVDAGAFGSDLVGELLSSAFGTTAAVVAAGGAGGDAGAGVGVTETAGSAALELSEVFFVESILQLEVIPGDGTGF